jgi:putative hydrolase of the HAD superfamily
VAVSDIELVVFDMDGVLAPLDRDRRLELLSAMTGLTARFIDDRVWQSAFERSAEAGAYPTGAEYLAEFNRLLGTTVTRDQWVVARREAMKPDPETIAIARRVSLDRIIALLTNNGSLLGECLQEIAPEVARVFGDHAHTSNSFGARKPEPEVFLRLLAHHEVRAEAAVFIDDCSEYVAAAAHVGMHAIHYTRPDPLRDDLARLGIDLT